MLNSKAISYTAAYRIVQVSQTGISHYKGHNLNKNGNLGIGKTEMFPKK